jgi:hypothetical protein
MFGTVNISELFGLKTKVTWILPSNVVIHKQNIWHECLETLHHITAISTYVNRSICPWLKESEPRSYSTQSVISSLMHLWKWLSANLSAAKVWCLKWEQDASGGTFNLRIWYTSIHSFTLRPHLLPGKERVSVRTHAIISRGLPQSVQENCCILLRLRHNRSFLSNPFKFFIDPSSQYPTLFFFLWLYSPLNLGRFLSFLILYTAGRTPWTTDQHEEADYICTKLFKNFPLLPWRIRFFDLFPFRINSEIINFIHSW